VNAEIYAPLAAASAGAVSSFGPCVAPRLIAVGALSAQSSGLQRWTRIGAFVAGLCAVYVAMGVAAGALGRLMDLSPMLYAAVAAAAAISGILVIVKAQAKHVCARDTPALPHGLGFFGGAACATITSPCCGGVAALSVAGAGAAGSSSALLLGAFALGHALPLFAFAAGSGRVRQWCLRGGSQPLEIVSGALMIALGAYYAVLA
jgi:cytochrome c biogenesis protein CcdA